MRADPASAVPVSIRQLRWRADRNASPAAVRSAVRWTAPGSASATCCAAMIESPAADGAPGAVSAIRPRYTWVRIEPRTATPIVPPISRTESFTPEATPISSRGAADRMMPVAGPWASASPAAMRTMAGTMTAQYGLAASANDTIQKPTPMSAMPRGMQRPIPKRRASTGASGEQAPMTAAKGRIASPARSAL